MRLSNKLNSILTVHRLTLYFAFGDLRHVEKMRQEIQEALQTSPAEGKSGGICKEVKEVQSADGDSKFRNDALHSML